MIKIEKLNPFGRMCISLGMLPSSYKESLTYEEQLLWFCNYLTETVIPTVNNNADAVEELQTLYTELKSYVDNYFVNIDVQQEINNKLDDMAESGELTDIIAQYLGLAGILAFNTKNDLKGASNLSNGTFVKTYGDITYNDGKGQFYKIRTLTNEDIIDNDNLVALTNYPLLVAEKIENYYINQMQTNLLDIQSNQLRNNKFILFGDSYASGEIGHSWISKLQSLIGINSSNFLDYSANGAGFTIVNNTFQNKLNEAIVNITNKNEITNILVAAGFNDGHFSNASESDIVSAIQTFITTAKNNFPNAKITIAHIGWTPEVTWKKDMRKSIKAYRKCIKFGAEYITNIEYTLHKYDLFLNDNIHPTETGCELIAENLYNGLLTGSCDVQYETTPVVASGNDFSNNYKLTSTVNNGISTFSIELTANSIISTTELSTPIDIANWSATILTQFNITSLCCNGDGNYRKHQTCNLLLVDGNGNHYKTLDLAFESNCLILLNNTGESYTGYKNFAFQGITFVDDSLYC